MPRYYHHYHLSLQLTIALPRQRHLFCYKFCRYGTQYHTLPALVTGLVSGYYYQQPHRYHLPHHLMIACHRIGIGFAI